MDFDPKDTAVVALLAKLKSAEVEYPLELFASRRQRFVQQAAAMGLAAGISPIPKMASPASAGGSAAVTWSGALEAILIIAIVAEAGVAAYFYRDQIADLLRSYSYPTLVTDVSIPPEKVSPLPGFTSTETPTPTMTSTGTSLPTVVINQNEEVENPHAVATSNPNGNNGNHYGQTPKPERTKEKGNNGGGGDDDKGKGKDK